VNKWTISDI